jgi:tRNA dimethylallyltransferase
MGPTASGKTDAALELVQRLPCDIISVDSAMIYRGMDIGTAKPSAEVRAHAPHRLIDICDPVERYSAAQFREDALREIKQIVEKDRIPLLVGGTFLYFRALEHGLAPLPAADEEVRQRIEEQARRSGWAQLHDRLAQVDPEAADRIHPNDPQRIQRALEVFELTGVPMTQLYSQSEANGFSYRAIKIILSPLSRSVLHERIEKRFDGMLRQGFVAEVEGFYRRGDLSLDLPSMRAVGYRQVWEYLDGKWDYNTMCQKGVTATRQYAKRQMTWLRSEQGANWFESRRDIYKEVLKMLKTSAIV